jgi:signal transduction histidine kinase
LPTTELRQPVERTISLLEEAIGETRALYTRLSPPTLAAGNLPDALQWLGEDIEAQWEMRVELNVTGESRSLSEDIRFTFFQAVRELLNNAHHHGQAEVVSVSVHFDNEAVTIQVNDNGFGFDISELGDELQQSEGFGLFNIRERISYLGGQMDIDSQLGRGTQVTMSIPLALSEDEAERDDDERGISK